MTSAQAVHAHRYTGTTPQPGRGWIVSLARNAGLAARFGVSQSLISAIQTNQWWKHVSS